MIKLISAKIDRVMVCTDQNAEKTAEWIADGKEWNGARLLAEPRLAPSQAWDKSISVGKCKIDSKHRHEVYSSHGR